MLYIDLILFSPTYCAEFLPTRIRATVMVLLEVQWYGVYCIMMFFVRISFDKMIKFTKFNFSIKNRRLISQHFTLLVFGERKFAKLYPHQSFALYGILVSCYGCTYVIHVATQKVSDDMQFIEYQLCAHLRMCVCVTVMFCVCAYVHTYIYICIYVRTYVRMYVCCVYTCVCTHLYGTYWQLCLL